MVSSIRVMTTEELDTLLTALHVQIGDHLHERDGCAARPLVQGRKPTGGVGSFGDVDQLEGTARIGRKRRVSSRAEAA